MMLRVSSRTSVSTALVLGLALPGCSIPTPSKPPTAPITVGIGGGCKGHADYRTGLTCDSVSGTCQPAGSTIQDAPCVLSAECMPGLYCAQDVQSGKCEPAGSGVVGDVCTNES